jgi:hypothetical protein
LPSGDLEEIRLFIRHLSGEESAFSKTTTTKDEDELDAAGPSAASLSLTPASPADEIDRCPQLKQWIIRWLDAIHPRDRIKNDLFLLLIVI